MKLIPIIGAFLLIAAMSLGGCAGLKEDPRSAKLNPNDRTNYPGQDGFNPALFALSPAPTGQRCIDCSAPAMVH